MTEANRQVGLLEDALDAAGGLRRWRRHSFLSARVVQGGGLWPMKGQAGVLDDVMIDAALHQEWVSHHPFGSPGVRSSFTPNRVELRDGDGETVEALDDPRASFAGHAFDTPWTHLQLAYFVGTAMWTYVTQPFCLALPGFTVEEPSATQQDAGELRRLRVTWPDYLATHSRDQTLYFDETGRLARHDYSVDIVAGATAAHLFGDFVTIDGITMPTRHRVHALTSDGVIDTSGTIVSIDVDNISFSQI